ncbi:MAG: gluconate 2-dehydrogenase subunit 3 family protein [Sphingomonas sp.]
MNRFSDFEPLDRRALMRRAMLLVGASAIAPPGLAFEVQGEAPFLSASRLDTLAAYADALIPATDTPGAIGAGVPRAVDAMLRDWASDRTRGEFAAVLDGLDTAAKKAGGALGSLAPERRLAVVTAFDAVRIAEQQTAAKAAADAIASQKALDGQQKSASGGRLADAAVADKKNPAKGADDPVASLAGPYGRLKDLVMTTYYLSEPGATKELRYELIPGVWEASMPLGADRRAWAV